MAQKLSQKTRAYNIVLVGKTGNGKSATGNTILGRKMFKDNSTLTSCTGSCSLESVKYGDVILNVIDTPGLMDTDKKQKEILDELANIMSLCPGGFNAFIFVLRWDARYTEEELETYKILKQFFGPDFLKFCVMAFTRGDYFMLNSDISFEDWLKRQTGALLGLLKDCNNKTVLFSNNFKIPEFKERRTESINQLIRFIRGGNLLYRNENFEKAAKERKKLATKYNLPQLQAKYQTELSLLESEINNVIQTETSRKELKPLEDLENASVNDEEIENGDSIQGLKKLSEHILALIDEDDSETGLLNDFRQRVEQLIQMISSLEKSQKNRELKLKKIAEYTFLLKNPPCKFGIVASSIALAGIAIGGALLTVLTAPIPPFAVMIAKNTCTFVSAGATFIRLNSAMLKSYKKSLKKLKKEIDNL